MKTKRLYYLLSGKEKPLTLTKREISIIDQCLGIINNKEDQIKKLEFMIKNGLGPEDMVDDISPMHEI